MSLVAEETGIGRATLYKYFASVEEILHAWHEEQVSEHLRQLAGIGHGPGSPGERLADVLEAYAFIAHGDHGTELASLLHTDGHLAAGRDHLRVFLTMLITEAADNGEIRDDIAPTELAAYCLGALAAARSLSSKAATRRLAAVTMSGLRLR